MLMETALPSETMKHLLTSLILVAALAEGDRASGQSLSSTGEPTGQERKLIPLESLLKFKDSAYYYTSAHGEVKLPFLLRETDIPVPRLRPDGRWLYASDQTIGPRLCNVGVYDLSVDEASFLAGKGFLGAFYIMQTLQFQEDWKGLKTERQIAVHEMALLSELTADGGPCATPEEAMTYLAKLRASQKEEDRTSLAKLETSADVVMHLNFDLKGIPIGRHFAGWLDDDTAIYWDDNSFRADYNPQPPVVLINYEKKTISIMEKTLRSRLKLAELSPEQRQNYFFKTPLAGADASAQGSDFSIELSNADYPDKARALVSASMRQFTYTQDDPERQKLLDAMDAALQSIPREQLPY